ncbi:unnamed protein product [Leptosia nina]|uniref:Uncharacterized protein n=1 Tax=Leptosia nina TaxID=320188 RepID=A0AAV1JD39_9NEOP
MRSWSRLRGWDRWRAAGLVAACALATLWLRVPVESRVEAHFPHCTPTRLAHFLADFSNHRRLDPRLGIGSWRIEDEVSNYSSWEYGVSYECGIRCTGRARVSTHDELAPREHRTRMHYAHCTPWSGILQRCEEAEVESVAKEAPGGGAVLQESARIWCGALQLLSGACRVRRLRDVWLRAVAEALRAEG